ncbi:isopenicillin N synthase family oxygenase [Caulobacter sp. SLTY]|uniref:isopenicillin N synthase family dioxygenase n=1 Tax=Caulobacter sp. SLTY TaxID=2683262 RepID=UPI0014133D6B|nr:isopenicillin N synthase family oxygenase [Caulobacter sp. SLTY]NBB14565.1 isopenicillin N synthase family oxygenase [Caulobacter sp. SLTY]
MIKRVPELSLKAYTHGDAASRAAFCEDLYRGLREYGFFTLADHNVSPDLLEQAYDLSARLFALPEATKRQYAAGMRGYTPFGVEHAKDNAKPDLKEFWQIGHDPSPDAPADEPFPANVWPAEVAEFEDVFTRLFAALNETGQILLRALAPNLGLPETWFDAKVKYGTSLLRVLHYPPVAGDADGAVRSAAHEDINFITILVAAKGAGLQLLDRDGTWLPVETASKNLIVDSGDMLQRLTNGLIPSTTHRVVNPDGAENVSRYSMPFFMHPTLATPLDVLPSCLGDGAKYPPITAGEFLHERLKAIGLAG